MSNKPIYSLIAFVLIVVSVILFVVRESDYIARAGIQPNEKIENMGELYEVTDLILSGLNTGKIQDDAKYNSATLHMSISEVIKVSQKFESKNVKQKIAIEQDITCYLAGEGMYIEAQAAIFTNSANEFDIKYEPMRNFAKYNLHLYLTEEKTYINISEYNMASNMMSMMLKPEYVNRWVEAPHNVDLNILLLEYEMEFTLDSFAKIFKALLDSGDINENETSVSFDENDLVHVDMGEIEDIDIDIEFEDLKENLKIDLTNKTRPYILISAYYKDKDIELTRTQYQGNSNITTKTKIGAAMEIVISNVNNTEIRWNVNEQTIETKLESLEDFERLFDIKIYKEIEDEKYN